MNLYHKPSGAETRWISFEHSTLERGSAGQRNKGAKGFPFDSVRAGETKTLMDIHASGTIRRIWITVGDRSPEMLRSLRLEMTWDDATIPAVSVPLGDFFGIGLGRTVAFESGLFSNPEGRSFNCCVPMPFRRSAKVTLTNDSDKDLLHLFYDIDLTIDEHELNDLYFHCTWRREQPNTLGEEFEILPHVKGSGRFLGCNIGVIVDPRYDGAWWGEGEVKFRFGGESEPTLCGTGTEDYIGTGWGQGQYMHRTQGCSVADSEKNQWAFYRYHLDDPVWFDGGCQASIQTIGGTSLEKVLQLQSAGVPILPITIDNGVLGGFTRLLELDEMPDLVTAFEPTNWCNFWREDDWSATAYYYLDHAEGTFSLPSVQSRIAGL